MTTYRERREARAARRRAWAEGREAKAETAQAAAEATASMIPFGQPILSGHHSEGADRRARGRMTANFQKAGEHRDMAAQHERAAATIDEQLARSIYDDDPDAVDRLREKLAALEAERERVKQANAAFRRQYREELRTMTSFERSQALPYPSYVGQNLSGRISSTRARIARLERSS